MALNKIRLREEFLNTVADATREIHEPILDPARSNGALNPNGLEYAKEFSQGAPGQSTVAFDTVKAYEEADRTRQGYKGSAEYGIVRTSSAARVSDKFAQLHGGKGAVVLDCGLAAISTTLSTFLANDSVILIPDNRYYPTERALNTMTRDHAGRKLLTLDIRRYPGDVTARGMANLLEDVDRTKKKPDILYLEAPGSVTFEIPDLHGIIAHAQKRGIRTVMDNSWASHARFRPIEHGVDVVIQATTKYEGGYADTPSGIVVAKSEQDFNALSDYLRAKGNGAVAPETCNRLFHRVASTEKRMNQHYESALEVIDWFKKQPAVDHILCPFDKDSPHYGAFQEYFKKGNGLFTVVFDENVPREKIEKFADDLLLFRVGESWGGHVSLVHFESPSRNLTPLPRGQMVRVSVGLEDPRDLLRDLNQASPALA